jgi:ankyrin repeat protein
MRNMAELMGKEKSGAKQTPKPRLGEPMESGLSEPLKNSGLDGKLIGLMDDFMATTYYPSGNGIPVLWEKVNEMVGMGANPDIRDSRFETVLMHAAAEGETETCRLLLEKGAMVNLKDQDGITALMKAAQNGHHGICELLIEKGARVDTKDWRGMTALHYAASADCSWICRILLESGADLWAKTMAGEEDTAMDYAKASDGLDAFYFLEEWELRKIMGKAANGFLAAFRECIKG